MGGCRCTYRNCTVRSDGKTHMFHYPVYDKLRCHQWILNARRHEFFNLTVSQVRNKVVCQHHFIDDYFMNYKKEKLKFEAVPTENGPYCDSKKDDIISDDASKIYPSIEKIEKDIYDIDKKANSTIKYADFLTKIHIPSKNVNFVTKDTDWLGPPKKIPEHEIYIGSDTKTQTFTHVYKNNYKEPLNCEPQEHSQHINIQQQCGSDENTHKPEENNTIYELNSNLQPIQPMNDPNYTTQTVHIHPYYDNLISLKSTNPTVNNDTGLNMPELNLSYKENQANSHQSYNENQLHNIHSIKDISSITKEEPKVRIISEKQISEPLKFTGKLEPVSPSLIIRLPRKRKEIDINTLFLQDQNTANKIQQYSDEIVPLNIGNVPNLESVTIVPAAVSESNIYLNPPSIDETVKNETSNLDAINNPKIEIEIEQNDYCIKNSETEKSQYTKSICENEKPSAKYFVLKNKSILKNKIAPERIAAIEKKRVFNKKLRDMVESCLEKSEIRKVKDSENIDSNGDAGVTFNASVQEHKTMASLEARLNKMEDMLAKKIEQNSEKILELKNCFVKGKSFTVGTQTCPKEESYKKYLYSEISQFLSPNASSLVYEELFINKYAQNEQHDPCEPKAKRRKRSQKWR